MQGGLAVVRGAACMQIKHCIVVVSLMGETWPLRACVHVVCRCWTNKKWRSASSRSPRGVAHEKSPNAGWWCSGAGGQPVPRPCKKGEGRGHGPHSLANQKQGGQATPVPSTKRTWAHAHAIMAAIKACLRLCMAMPPRHRRSLNTLVARALLPSGTCSHPCFTHQT